MANKFDGDTYIQDKVKEVLYNSAAQGSIKIVLSKNIPIKILWIVCLLATISICSYMVIEGVFAFFNYDVTTKIRYISEIPTHFPAVTICNKHRFSSSKGYEFLVNKINKKEIPDIFNISKLPSVDKQVKIDTLLNSFNLKNLTNSELRSLGNNLSTILISCYFDNDLCDAADFDWYFDNRFGGCYKFNSGFNKSILSSKHSGTSFGLSLTLFASIPETLKTLYSNIGIIVKLDNSSYTGI